MWAGSKPAPTVEAPHFPDTSRPGPAAARPNRGRARQCTQRTNLAYDTVVNDTPAPVAKKQHGHLRRRLVAGALLLVPIVFTYLLLRWTFFALDGLLLPTVERVTERIFGEPRSVPGMGIIAVIVLVYILGVLGTNIAGRWIINSAQGVLLRIPVVNSVYRASKQMVDSMAGPLSNGRQRVVLFQVPEPGTYTVAIVTGKVKDERGNDLLALYIPTAPTPNSGYLAYAEPEHVRETNMSMGEAMKLVVSCGVLVPNTLIKRPFSKGQ